MRHVYILFMCLLAFQGAAYAVSYKAKTCSYSNLDTNVFADGSCTMQDTKLNGNFTYLMNFKNGTKASIEYLEAQGGMHSWRINGKPGMGFEIDREHLIGGTVDLKQFVEWRDR